MNVQVLQHVPFEDAASIEPWLLSRGASIRHTRFFTSWTLPDPRSVDLVIAMGGPMSVNDEAELNWLAPEKEFLRQAIQRGVSVLGICLGAQLLASALGARVHPSGRKEIGWFDIEAVPSPGEGFRFPARALAFHWHGETFDLPDGAVHLARSAACQNQAFQFGTKVIGLQFHLETTPESAASLMAHCGDELVDGEFIQSAAELRAAPPARYAQANALMGEVLAYLTGGTS